ncbi:MAG: acyl-CoA dehydrogenase family protein [Pseudomonadota bacterium]
MGYELQPVTDAGKRFVELAEQHAESFRQNATDNDLNARCPVEHFDELRRSGFAAAFVPKELGGLGLESVHDWVAGINRLGRGDASIAIGITMHLGSSRGMTQAWQQAIKDGDTVVADAIEPGLKAIQAGERLIYAGFTEPGTDFLHPLTEATRTEDGGWSVNGLKIFATMSPAADFLAMNVRMRDEDGDKFGMIQIPANLPGILPQDDWDSLGMRASGSQSVVFKDCRLPFEAVRAIGEWGEWNLQILIGRTVTNLVLLGAFLGIAEEARAVCMDKLNSQKKASNTAPHRELPNVQHALGELEIELTAAQTALTQAAQRLDASLAEYAPDFTPWDVAHQNMKDFQCVKWIVNQNAIRIVNQAMDLAGGGGYMNGGPLARLYRDVRAGPFMQPYPPTEARQYIGKVALGFLPKS